MTMETPGEQADLAALLIERLRGEIEATTDRTEQSYLQHEVGVLHERRGEEPLAARDYLAAYNADSEFREPLQALVRILSRRRSFKNLAKLLDTIAKGAPTAQERSHALRELAVVALEQARTGEPAGQRDEAKALLEEAVAQDPDDSAAWIELELLSAADGDAAGVARAIEARLPLLADATYKALLYIQLADLASKTGQHERAYEHLDAAAALEGRARFQTRLVLERVAANAGDLDALARALEGQAEIIAEVLDDPERGEEIGVPKFLRAPACAADAWLRAAEIRRRLGDIDAASALLAQAAQRLPTSSTIARARLAALEAQGQIEAVAQLAGDEIARGAEGASAAALWLRIAEASAVAEDRPAALDALRQALAADPGAIPARAIELDLLADGHDPTAFAEAIEATTQTFRTDAARARGWLLAAYVWSCQVRELERARAALAKAVELGLEPALAARLGRSFASLAADAAWYEASTQALLATELDPTEVPGLWFELGRSRLLRGDTAGAEQAFAELSRSEGTGAFARAPWLGMALSATAVGLRPGDAEAPAARSAAAMDALGRSESDPALARGFRLVAALRASRAGDFEGASARLEALHQESPGDEIVAVAFAELLREANPLAASRVLSACAEAHPEPELGAALRLESALYAWKAGERARAVAELELAREALPAPSSALSSWMRRGLDASSLEARRAMLAVGEGPALELERLGLELAHTSDGIDEGAALAALEALEHAAIPGDELSLAAALARLLWSPAFEQADATSIALDRLEAAGGDARRIARAERLRIRRDLEGDPAGAVEAAQAWSEVEPTAAAALEWLVAAVVADDRASEAEARAAVAAHLDPVAADAMRASAALVSLLDQPGRLHPLLQAQHAAGRLLNLELAPPGCDPRRRATALHGLGDALGDDAQIDALLLAGWSDLAGGQGQQALETFGAVVEARPEDIAGWEGMHAAAELLDDPVQIALSCAQLGALSKDDARGAGFWEKAGLVLLERTDAHEDAEIALERAFQRDATASKAFDKLFRRVRERKEDDKLLALIERRLDVADDESEIGKLFWERARVLQKRGDNDGALSALENVTMLEPDHVGALVLMSTICIQKGDFAGAAPLLARVSKNAEAPQQQRLVSGVSAADFFENKLSQPEKALEVLVGLHEAGLSTIVVRERLARAAARTGAWSVATGMLERLMTEREQSAGRVEAARLCMAIWRDKLREPKSAEAAVRKLLDEIHDDPEALDLVLATDFDGGFRVEMLSRGKQQLVKSLQDDPCDVDRVALLARVAAAQGDMLLRQAALGALIALGKPDRGISDELAALDAKIRNQPENVLDARALAEIADPGDSGPVAEMFAHIAETVTLALGPTLDTLGVGRRNRVDAKGGPPLRLAVTEWMGALGFGEFELYVGGPEANGVQGVAGDVPAVVVGAEVHAPFDASARSAVAREVFALRRGLSAVRTRDDAAVASVVIAVCNEVGLNLPTPNYAVYSDLARAVHKEISRKVKKSVGDVAQRVAQSGQDPKQWASSARRSIDRMAVIAAGDVSIVLSELLRAPRHELASLVRENERARALLRFVLSPGYLELRRKLGMGVQ